ncbi:MAG: hypothetical protein BJ554DRAFT_6418, partial [Olpidium bornovanus]
MADRELNRFVSDSLLKLVGVSERHLVDYLVATAKRAASPDAFRASLADAGVDAASDQAKVFAAQLWARVPRAAASSAAGRRPAAAAASASARSRDAEAHRLRMQNDSFELLRDDDGGGGAAEDDEAARRAAKQARKAERKKGKEDAAAAAAASREREKGRSLRKRENRDDAWAENEAEEEERRRRLERARNRERQAAREPLPAPPPEIEIDEGAEDEYERAERNREEDARERDEFAERLRERDLAATRTKLTVEDRSSKDDPESRRRRNLADDLDARRAALPEIRERSRQEYLSNRERDRLELLRRKIADEELLFKDYELTAEERDQHLYDKEVLRLAEERLQIKEAYNQHGYVMPEDYITEKGKIDKERKQAVLYQRYEEKDNGKPVSDFDTWEQQQIHHAAKKTRELQQDEYDFVFDEQKIDFVLESTLHANRKKDEILAQLDEVKRR